MKIRRSLFLVLLLFAPASADDRYGNTDTSRWYKNAFTWDNSPVDLSFFNRDDQPAGRRGFVKAVGDHFTPDRRSPYFVTMSVVDWLPVIVSEGACRILAESLNFCHEHKGLRVNAYVSMPTHLHGIVFLRQFDPEALRATLIDFCKFTGRRLIEY
jgi:hypothetical protein